MIEPHSLTSLGVSRDGLSYLTCPQAITAFPFKLCPSLVTILFYFSFIRGLKNILPAKVDALTVISDIHDSLADEPLFNPRVDPRKYFSIISNRCGSSF